MKMKVESVCLRVVAGCFKCPQKIHPVRWGAMLRSAENLLDLVAAGYFQSQVIEVEVPDTLQHVNLTVEEIAVVDFELFE